MAVTTTLMMMAGGRTPERSTLVKSYNKENESEEYIWSTGYGPGYLLAHGRI